MAAILAATVAVAAYVVNTTYAEVARTELQIATDLATRAACREFAKTDDRALALAKARRVAAENPVAARTLDISSLDLVYKTATRFESSDEYSYQSRSTAKNSVTLSASYFQRSEEGIAPLIPIFGKTTFRPIKRATAIEAELDMVIVLDCSTSMLAPLDARTGLEVPINLPLFQPAPDSRWGIACDGIRAIVERCKGSKHRESIGITCFGKVALHGTPLSENYEPIEMALGVSQTAYIGGLSNLGDGIRAGIGALSNSMAGRPWATRVMLLISDGRSNFGPSIIDAANLAANEYIMIYTLSLAAEANVTLMEEIAALTHARHFHVETPQQIGNVMNEISDRLPILLSK